MPLNLKRVGTEDLLVQILGDPTAASNLASVLAVSDNRNLAGLYALLTQNIPLLLAPDGNVDQQRSAPGTTGIPSVVTEGTKLTYSNGILDFTPAATATDFWGLVGHASKVIRLLWLAISGFATSADSREIQLVRRSTLNTGGTPTDPAILVHDSNDGVAGAVVRHYAANPTMGTLVAVARTERLKLGAVGDPGRIFWDFTTRNGKGLVLRDAAHMYALNWNGATVPAGTKLTIATEWSEE